MTRLYGNDDALIKGPYHTTAIVQTMQNGEKTCYNPAFLSALQGYINYQLQ